MQFAAHFGHCLPLFNKGSFLGKGEPLILLNLPQPIV